MEDYFEQLEDAYTDRPLPASSGSLLNGCDPSLPERWQGERPSLTSPRDKDGVLQSWREGERHAVQLHPVLTLNNARRDVVRLIAELQRLWKGLDVIPPLEWRRILDCAFICGIKGWSNIRRNTLGDGSWRPLVRSGVRFKVGSDGRVIYADA